MAKWTALVGILLVLIGIVFAQTHWFPAMIIMLGSAFIFIREEWL